MKIHYAMAFLFILHCLPFSFSLPLKGEKIAKEGVDKLAPFVYFVTQETRDTISYAPAVNTILTEAMFLCVLYYIVDFIIRANIQLRQIDFDVFRTYFAIIQLVCHVNHLVNKRL